MKTPNYTQAQVAQIVDQYQAGQDINEIASAIGKSVRSVRSKLVREGVYISQPKTGSKKVLGPTKKELLKSVRCSYRHQRLGGCDQRSNRVSDCTLLKINTGSFGSLLFFLEKQALIAAARSALRQCKFKVHFRSVCASAKPK
jgi:hypothetical protein